MRESDEQIIEDMERQIAEGRELEGYARVNARVPQNLSVTYAIRLSPDEYQEFSHAAKTRDMTLANLMRSATRAALSGEVDAERAAALSNAQKTARELADTLDGL